ncbi:hypothetical protein NKI54_32830 [Mesorhizobium sp. M0663]
MAKLSLHLPSRQPFSSCQVRHGKRRGQVPLHQHYEFYDRGVEPAMLAQQGQPLALVALADTTCYGQLPHIHRDGLAAMMFYKVDHHIESCRAAGAAPDVVVDLVDGGCRLNAHEPLLEGWQRLPMNGAPAVVEQASLGQSGNPASKTACPDPALPAFTQPCAQHFGFSAFLRLIAADQSQDRAFRLHKISALLGEVGVSRHYNAATGTHRFTRVRHSAPAEGFLPRRLVGKTEDVQDRRQGEKFEAGRQIQRNHDRLGRRNGRPRVLGPVVNHIRLSALFS